MPHILPPLPYAPDDLAPHISPDTLKFHYGKHHQTYIDNLNKLVVGTAYEALSLTDTILKSAKDNVSIFNNSAQVWNHSFYWSCMKSGGGGEPSGELGECIKRDFGSFQKFADEFKQAALTQFGSGWAWLVWDGKKLSIRKTANADLPMIFEETALLTCDVWEHAYYIDYQNRRADYVTRFLDSLANWDFASNCFQRTLC